MSSIENKYKKGHLSLLDDIPNGSEDVANAVNMYADYVNQNKVSSQWLRAVQWIENTLFGLGRQYYDNALISRISSNGSNLSVNEQVKNNIPKPTNDLLGRFIETNVALLTENRPIPRITAKGDSLEDKHAAMLAELNIEFLWEELDLPEKHREIARLLLYTGIAWLEVCFDPFVPRHMSVPAMEPSNSTVLPNGVTVPIPGKTPKIDPNTGQIVYEKSMEYGDIVANILSGFQMHIPNIHSWNDNEMGWIMKETYSSIDEIKNKYLNPKISGVVTKRNGYYLDRVENIDRKQVTTLPLWWWERMTDMVEGPGTSMYGGTPEMWEDYTTVRVLDRKPSYKWPKGRTIVLAGNKVIYDSPKSVGARAFDERWPKRWHPYTRYRWEPQLGSPWGRSLVSKLLPKLKRINSIDTCLIMWRRTVPISTWISPKGSVPVEGLNSGEPGTVWSFDPNRTRGMKPEPVYPPPFPSAALEERQMQMMEMETIAGTEQVLRGERPVGVNCWTEDSILTDAVGMPVNVKDIIINDSHMSLKGSGPIGLVHKNEYEGNVIQIKSWGNFPVKVTPGHKFPIIKRSSLKLKKSGRRAQNKKTNKCFVPDISTIEKVEAKDIANGDLVLSGFFRDRKFNNKLDLISLGGTILSNQIKNINWIPTSIELDKDILWMFGMYLAEGHVTQGEVIWTLNENEMNLANRIKDIVKNYFNINSKIIPVKDKEAIRVITNSCPLSRVFKNLFGTGSRKKFISKLIFNNDISLLPLVSGWLDGDGSRNDNTLVGATMSKSLVSQMRSILLDEKIYATINFFKKKEMHVLHITGEEVNRVAENSIRFEPNFRVANRGRRGFWVGNYYASYVYNIKNIEYKGFVYNVTMDERTGCDNSVNSFGLFTYQSSSMLETLRKQALASRSSILQAWDESLQLTGTALIQETIKHIKDDVYYRDRINLLAREKSSQFSIDQFSGQNLQDNVIVRIDTASMALMAREAKQERAMQVIQYGPALVQLPSALQAKLLNDLGWPDVLVPSGPDINRARAMIQYVKAKRFNLAVPMPEDDPYVMHDMLVVEIKNESFFDLSVEVQMKLYQLIEYYREQIKLIEQARLQQQMQLAQMGQPQ